jgi:hypothetical protein
LQVPWFTVWVHALLISIFFICIACHRDCI